jgi:hypothetical protein
MDWHRNTLVSALSGTGARARLRVDDQSRAPDCSLADHRDDRELQRHRRVLLEQGDDKSTRLAASMQRARPSC